VLYCNKLGATDLSVAGLDWVAQNAVKPAVVNFSMMHNASAAVDLAAKGILAKGIMFVTIATNSFQSVPGTNLSYGGDACQWSPARISTSSDAITVASSNRSDQRSWWSGYGSCVTLFAPGEEVTSVLPFGSVSAWNGTSMAAPHVAGAIARYLERNPSATVPQIKSWLLANATPNVISDPAGSPNLLLNAPLAQTQAAPKISLSPASVSFSAQQGGASPSPASVGVTNGGSGTLSGIALGAVTYGAGQPTGWLTATLSGATAPTTLTLTPTVGALAAGTYTATVPVTSTAAGVTNSPQQLAVTFVVSPRPSPQLGVSFTVSCAGTTCTFTASATAAVSGYRWNFGDKATAGPTSQTSVTHTYGNGGKTYTVTVTATGLDGSTASASRSVTCTSAGKGGRSCS
jgi:hypothetical protein